MTAYLLAAHSTAGTTAHDNSVISAPATLAILGVLLLRRVREQRLQVRQLIIRPVILVALRWALCAPQLRTTTFHSGDLPIGAIDVLASLVLGTIRGFTVHISHHDGGVWYRYRWSTFVLWFVSILIRVALAIVGSAHHVSALIGGDDLLVLFGLSVLCQNLIVAGRNSEHPRRRLTP